MDGFAQAQKGKMMNDLISRQAAVDLWEKYHHTIAVDAMQYDVELRQLPSAQQERPKGNWVEIGDEPYDEWECDVCGFVIDGSGCIDPEEYRDVYKFCPNCGAYMRKREGDNV